MKLDIQINITEKHLLIVVMAIIFCVALTRLRPPTPYESFNKQINQCSNAECRTQVIGFYRQTVRELQELEQEEIRRKIDEGYRN